MFSQIYEQSFSSEGEGSSGIQPEVDYGMQKNNFYLRKWT